MATVEEHYSKVLGNVYSWMFGGFDSGVRQNIEFFKKYDINPTKSGLAIDLGAGCGFQSIPLAQSGFKVTAIDLDRQLLDELKANSDNFPITIVQDDLINFEQHTNDKVELITCMTDTMLHLESKDTVSSLFAKVFLSLVENGKFIATFRDLSTELTELNRFIPVKNDENTLLTCFLEYEPDTVKVHDLVYEKSNDGWKLNKSFYRKLRLSQQWVEKQLKNAGFDNIVSQADKGMVTIMATK